MYVDIHKYIEREREKESESLILSNPKNWFSEARRTNNPKSMLSFF
jgi:hypothetical protein